MENVEGDFASIPEMKRDHSTYKRGASERNGTSYLTVACLGALNRAEPLIARNYGEAFNRAELHQAVSCGPATRLPGRRSNPQNRAS